MTQALAAIKALVVDDNAHMRSIVRQVLEAGGVRQVREASDGSHALALLRTWPADVVFSDFRMTPMDGLELVKRLRHPDTSPNPRVAIVMMTGYAERASVLAARDAGVSEFIAKPVTAKAIVERLHAALFNARPFVRSSSYVGPSRRRITPPGEPAQKRRAEDVLWLDGPPAARKAS